jgi:hypothetical protein
VHLAEREVVAGLEVERLRLAFLQDGEVFLAADRDRRVDEVRDLAELRLERGLDLAQRVLDPPDILLEAPPLFDVGRTFSDRELALARLLVHDAQPVGLDELGQCRVDAPLLVQHGVEIDPHATLLAALANLVLAVCEALGIQHGEAREAQRP